MKPLLISQIEEEGTGYYLRRLQNLDYSEANRIRLTVDERRLILEFDGTRQPPEIAHRLGLRPDAVETVSAELVALGCAVDSDVWCRFSWCAECHVAVLGDRCGSCRNAPNLSFQVRPPGNPRPARATDLPMLQALGLAPSPQLVSLCLVNVFPHRGVDHWQVFLDGRYWATARFERTAMSWVPVDRAASLPQQKALDWIADPVEANRTHLERIAADASESIRQRCRNLPGVVFYSGGKDSGVVLDLAAENKPTVVFYDTGGEHPETPPFVKEEAGARNLPLHVVSRGNLFWTQLEQRGAPSRDHQWCCKVLKTCDSVEPEVARLVDGKTFAGFWGLRRREELARLRLAPEAMISKGAATEIRYFPILEWTDYDVWLYHKMRNLRVNPVYGKGFERVACWFCVGRDLRQYARVKELYPGLWESREKWLGTIDEWDLDTAGWEELVRRSKQGTPQANAATATASPESSSKSGSSN